MSLSSAPTFRSCICGRVFDTNFADDMFNTQSCVLKFAHPYCCTMEPRQHVVLDICSQHVFRVATAPLYSVCEWAEWLCAGGLAAFEPTVFPLFIYFCEMETSYLILMFTVPFNNVWHGKG